MKRPAFQFYPGDWLRDTALGSCSLEARGLWIELLCRMHDGKPYGHLALRGEAIPPQKAAQLLGLHLARYQRLIGELTAAGVAQYDDKKRLFSSRMVRDEEVREKRAEGGIKSIEHPNTLKPKPHGEGYPSTVPSNGTLQGSPEGWNGVPPPASASASATAKNSPNERLLDGEPPTAAAPPVAGNALVRREGRTHEAVLDHLKVMLAPERREAVESLKAEAKRRIYAEIVFAYWALKLNHEHALYDEVREGILVRALKANRDNVSELLYVVDGARRDPWPDRKDHNGIEVLYRNRAQVERFASFCPAYREGQPHPTALRYGLAETQNAPA